MKEQIDDEAMRLIADLLKSVMPANWGFTLLTFEVNSNPAIVNYISTGNREDMIQTMKTMISKWENIEDFKKPNLN